MSAAVVLASGNAGKAREFERLLTPPFTVRLQSEWGIEPVPETATTYVENALLKARHAAAVTGLPAIADDSGLEVDALGGGPGLYSARYAGPGARDEDHVRKLLQALQHTPEPERGARFRCIVVCLQTPEDPAPLIAEGVWEGHILRQPQGVRGFGYDPVFCPRGYTQSSAELDADTKNRLSHRGQALRLLAAALAELPSRRARTVP